VGLVSLLRELPNQVDQVLHDVETGNLQVRVILPAVDELAPMLQKVGGRITLALFAAAMSLCGSILLPGETGTGTTPFLGIAAIVLTMVAWTALLLWHVFGDTNKIRLSPWLRYFRRK